MAEVVQHIRVAADMESIAVIDLRRENARLRHIDHWGVCIAAIPIYQTIRRDDRSQVRAEVLVVTDDVGGTVAPAFAKMQDGESTKPATRKEFIRTSAKGLSLRFFQMKNATKTIVTPNEKPKCCPHSALDLCQRHPGALK